MPVSLESRVLIEPAVKLLAEKYFIPYPEYNFSNDFFFQNTHRYEVVESPFLGIRGHSEKKGSFFIPAFDIAVLNEGQLTELLKFAKRLYPIPESWLDFFSPLHVQISYAEADSDYIYRIEKMKLLNGRNLSSRRNLLYQFEREYVAEFIPLNLENKIKAEEVLEIWQNENGGENDYLACQMALDNFAALNIFGYICLANGDPVGFVIGEVQTPTMAILHFAKSLHSYKGVTPYLYSHFASALPETVEWINLEQDLGIPSLRQAKMAYAPDHLEKKFSVELKS